MVAVHRIVIHGTCPHGCPDVYTGRFKTTRMIPVEVVEAAIKCCTLTPIYQESLTQRLADILACEVTLNGMHGNFYSETIAGTP